MRAAPQHHPEPEVEPVRVLGRGLRADRGVRLTLRVLREAAGKTQMELTALTQMDQGDISRLERRSEFDDCQIATLRRYLEALGGRLQLVACFGDKRITVVGSKSETAAQPGAAPVGARPGGLTSSLGKRDSKAARGRRR